MNLTKLSKEIHEANVAKGFYDNDTSVGERLALIHSEVSECLEADRQGRLKPSADPKYILRIEGKDLFVGNFRSEIKDTGADELADIIIRCLDFAAHEGMDIDSHVHAKLRYNATRAYKHGKTY